MAGLPRISVLPKLTEAKVSPKGKVNIEDIQKILKNALIFFTPTIVLYLSQLTGALADHTLLAMSDMIPSPFVIGAFEAYIIATFIDYLRKLNNGKQ